MWSIESVQGLERSSPRGTISKNWPLAETTCLVTRYEWDCSQWAWNWAKQATRPGRLHEFLLHPGDERDAAHLPGRPWNRANSDQGRNYRWGQISIWIGYLCKYILWTLSLTYYGSRSWKRVKDLMKCFAVLSPVKKSALLWCTGELLPRLVLQQTSFPSKFGFHFQLCAFIMHRMEKYYQDPLVFNPERWLAKDYRWELLPALFIFPFHVVRNSKEQHQRVSFVRAKDSNCVFKRESFTHSKMWSEIFEPDSLNRSLFQASTVHLHALFAGTQNLCWSTFRSGMSSPQKSDKH